MARITEFFLVDTPRQDALAVFGTVEQSEIPVFINEGLKKLEERFKETGAMPADCPFLQVAEAEEEGKLKVLVGTATPEPIEGEGDVVAAHIPPGPKMMCYWQGSNAGMFPMYGELKAFAEEMGFKMNNASYEYFLNGPEVGMENLLTRVVVPLVKAES